MRVNACAGNALNGMTFNPGVGESGDGAGRAPRAVCCSASVKRTNWPSMSRTSPWSLSNALVSSSVNRRFSFAAKSDSAAIASRWPLRCLVSASICLRNIAAPIKKARTMPGEGD